MFIFKEEYDQLKALEIKVAELSAKVYYLQIQVSDKDVELGRLRKEKEQLNEDLMIALGVKVSKQQQELIDRQMSQSEREPSFAGQGRHWAHQRTGDVINQLALDKREDAKRLIEEMELDALS